MIAAILSLTLLGAVLGVVLGIASKFLSVEGNTSYAGSREGTHVRSLERRPGASTSSRSPAAEPAIGAAEREVAEPRHGGHQRQLRRRRHVGRHPRRAVRGAG